jgi:hypothetical protein
MTKQTLVTITNTDFGGADGAHLTIVTEGVEHFRIIGHDRVQMFLTNLSGTAAALGFQVTVRDLRTKF